MSTRRGRRRDPAGHPRLLVVCGHAVLASVHNVEFDPNQLPIGLTLGL